MKNDLRIKKEYEEFAKTVHLPFYYSLKNQASKLLFGKATSDIGKAISMDPRIQCIREVSTKSIFNFCLSTHTSHLK